MLNLLVFVQVIGEDEIRRAIGAGQTARHRTRSDHKQGVAFPRPIRAREKSLGCEVCGDRAHDRTDDGAFDGPAAPNVHDHSRDQVCRFKEQLSGASIGPVNRVRMDRNRFRVGLAPVGEADGIVADPIFDRELRVAFQRAFGRSATD